MHGAAGTITSRVPLKFLTVVTVGIHLKMMHCDEFGRTETPL